MMKLYKNATAILILLTLLVGITSCKKFLDQKPIKSMVVPNNFDDLQALLDNSNIINASGPALLELVADNYYLTDNDWARLPDNLKLNYIWDKDAIPHDPSWINVYQGPIYYSNIVLDQLKSIKDEDDDINRFNAIKGSALFYRAFAFFELAQLFCKPYSTSVSAESGIVLRLTSNINTKSIRSTLQQTYDQIIGDLKEAGDILPSTSLFPTRPTKAAAYGALARTYLAMRDYVNAGKYADMCLQQKGSLIDYNSLVSGGTVGSPPVPQFNAEVIFHNRMLSVTPLANSRAKIDSSLYDSYDDNDLRKTVFFRANTGVNKGTYGFQGSYSPYFSVVYYVFDGIATDEMYLIRAECFARTNNISSAMNDLNMLLRKRWKIGTFNEVNATDVEDAKSKILAERRKELVYRGLRWTDLRRLNLEGANITLTRKVGGEIIPLPPDDNRWVMLIPYDVVNRSGIQQNLR